MLQIFIICRWQIFGVLKKLSIIKYSNWSLIVRRFSCMDLHSSSLNPGRAADSKNTSPICFQVPFFLFIIFTVYTMLPFQLWYAVVLSVISSLSHIIALTVRLTIDDRGASPDLAYQVKWFALKIVSFYFRNYCNANVSICSCLYCKWLWVKKGFLRSLLLFLFPGCSRPFLSNIRYNWIYFKNYWNA